MMADYISGETGELTMADCEHCKYASWDYDDAYGATVWWVEGCKRKDQGLECVMEEWEDDDG